jgi:hypothetical protein
MGTPPSEPTDAGPQTLAMPVSYQHIQGEPIWATLYSPDSDPLSKTSDLSIYS